MNDITHFFSNLFKAENWPPRWHLVSGVDLIHPDDRDEYLHKWNESLNNGEDFEMEKRLLGADGKYYWHLSRAHAQRDENANIIMWVGTATDIEMQKRANELLEKQVNERTEEKRTLN